MLSAVVRPSQHLSPTHDPAVGERPVVVSRQQAWTFVKRWESAWNYHDLDAIMAFYRDNVEFRSPFVRHIDGEEPGELHGKEALSDYFASALERFPTLTIEVLDVVVGVRCLTIHCRGISGLLSTETMNLDHKGQIWRVDVQYRSQTV